MEEHLLIISSVWTFVMALVVLFSGVRYFLRLRPMARESAGRLLIHVEKVALTNARCLFITISGFMMLAFPLVALGVTFSSTNRNFAMNMYLRAFVVLPFCSSLNLARGWFSKMEIREHGLVHPFWLFISWDRIKWWKWDKYLPDTLLVQLTDFCNVKIPVVASQKQAIENILREHVGWTVQGTSTESDKAVLVASGAFDTPTSCR